MEVFCGNYMDYKPKRRIPWLRYIFILLLVSGTTAAAPAVISYYWDGKNSEHTLHVEEAARVIIYGTTLEPMRKSAGLRLFMIATKAISALNDAQALAGPVGDDALYSIVRLKKQLGCKE